MTIYHHSKPTFLYIKQHSITGMLYFGKTIRNPEKYLGSGKYWTSHIATHGKQYVVNLWYCMFCNSTDLEEFALLFSRQEDIVKSTDWANLCEENGLHGGVGTTNGRRLTQQHKDKIAKGNTGKIVTQHTRDKLSDSNRRRGSPSLETRAKMSERRRSSLFNKNKRWWTDGVNNIQAVSQPNGDYWRLGRTRTW